MKNYLRAGRTSTFIAPYAVASGAGFVVGSLFAVAKTDAAMGAEVEGELEGVFAFPKTAGAANSDAAQGAKIYFDTVLKTYTKTAGSNTVLIGATTRAATVADAVYRVRLNGVTL